MTAPSSQFCSTSFSFCLWKISCFEQKWILESTLWKNKLNNWVFFFIILNGIVSSFPNRNSIQHPPLHGFSFGVVQEDDNCIEAFAHDQNCDNLPKTKQASQVLAYTYERCDSGKRIGKVFHCAKPYVILNVAIATNTQKESIYYAHK